MAPEPSLCHKYDQLDGMKAVSNKLEASSQALVIED